MTAITLEELTKSTEIEISKMAKRMLELGYPKHACFEIVLKQTIK